MYEVIDKQGRNARQSRLEILHQAPAEVPWLQE